jgi:hypothetical protein
MIVMDEDRNRQPRAWVILEGMTIQLDLKKTEPQRLKCDGCGNWLILSLEEQTIHADDMSFSCYAPFLRCVDCGGVYLPDETLASLEREVSEAKASGNRLRKLSLKTEEFQAKRFSFCNRVQFDYDPIDYFFLPGLVRPTSTGFLTPVFFNRDVLVQYYHHPDYTVSFGSDTYGTIYTPSNCISFGINRSGKIIMWLGDIDDMPQSEQLYLASKNIASDHDIGSEFYEGQIEVEFTEYSKEQLVVKKLSEFADEIFKKYKVKILQLDDEALPLIKSLKPPIHFSEKEMGEAMEVLNKLLVERLNSAALKHDLQSMLTPSEAKKLKSLGALKTLELWLHRRASVADASTRMNSLFVLYDLRVVFKHLQSEKTRSDTLRSCSERLKLAHGATNKSIYNALAKGILAFYSETPLN